MFNTNAFNYLVQIAVRSLKHHRIPPSKQCLVHRVLTFCTKSTQYVDLPDPVGPLIIRVN